ncbi:MAG: T9SS type A sorting domain-containing protein [Chitinophagales bacterium]
MKKTYLYLLLLFLFNMAFSQEELVPISKNIYKTLQNNQQFLQKKAQNRTAALALPFFDDFNQPESYPNPLLWQDNFVYINAHYPKDAITLGVATFDGTNNIGNPYSSATNAKGYADKLTSNTIDLSGLTNDSAVFLSFFYLIGEYGESPEKTQDFFNVQFIDTAGNWTEVAHIIPDTTVNKMKQVYIKVDSNYLHANFQFRFNSYGSLNGINDIWHIDYVRLDKNRDTSVDKNLKEMAYEFLPGSILKKYYVMPYYQFDSTQLKDTVSVFIKNNFINVTTDYLDFYNATLVNTSTVISSGSGPPLGDFGPNTENEIKYPKFNIPDDLTDDTVIVKIDYNFTTTAEAGEPAKVLANNTVTHNQVFSNFYAYDDGTPERGYRVYDLPYYKMAVKYTLKKPDTLQAIKFKFVPVDVDNKLATFSVCVWKNIARNTDYDENQLIYQEPNLTINRLIKEYGVDTLNGYYYAPIKPEFLKNGVSFPLLLKDSFAVGVLVENAKSLVVGFDRNNNGSENNFYVSGTNKWLQSAFAGSMIMNPVVGKPLPSYLTPVNEIKSPSYIVKIFPNPTKYNLSIEGIKSNSLLQIYSVTGNLVSEQRLDDDAIISVEQFPAATYLLKITNLKTKQTGITKFIKSE